MTALPPSGTNDTFEIIAFDFSAQDIQLPAEGFFFVITGRFTSSLAFGIDAVPEGGWMWVRGLGGTAWSRPLSQAGLSRQVTYGFFTRESGSILTLCETRNSAGAGKCLELGYTFLPLLAFATPLSAPALLAGPAVAISVPRWRVIHVVCGPASLRDKALFLQ